MKNILRLLAILFFFSTKAYSQMDTLNYLKQFEVKYVGQPTFSIPNNVIMTKVP